VKKLNRDCILYYEVKVVYYCFWWGLDLWYCWIQTQVPSCYIQRLDCALELDAKFSKDICRGVSAKRRRNSITKIAQRTVQASCRAFLNTNSAPLKAAPLKSGRRWRNITVPGLTAFVRRS
jgi:hypothetical protein